MKRHLDLKKIDVWIIQSISLLLFIWLFQVNILKLNYNYGHGPYTIGDGFSHLAIASDDLEGDNEKHKALGYETTDIKGLPGKSGHYYFVTDPDGYRMEVIRAK